MKLEGLSSQIHKYSNCPKILITVFWQTAYAHGSDPDHTAPEESVRSDIYSLSSQVFRETSQ